MANEADLKLKEIGEFDQTTTVSGSGEEYIVVRKSDGKTYKMSTADFKAFLGTVQTIVPRAISPTDPAPTLPGIYRPTVSGSYANLGGLVVDMNGKLNEVLFDGTSFVNVVTLLPETDISDLAKTEYVDRLGGSETIVIGKNKFDTSTLQNNKYINPTTGLLVDNTNPAVTWHTYGPFDLSEADTWTFSNKRGGGNIMWYDDNDAKVGSKIDLSFPPTGILQSTGNTQTRPANAKYVRYDVVVSTIPLEEPQIEMGSEKTAYEPFSKKTVVSDSPAIDLVKQIVRENSTDAVAPNKMPIKRRILLVGQKPIGGYMNRIPEDLYRCGFLHEYVSNDTFVRDADLLKLNYDVIVLTSTSFDYGSSFTLLQYKEALQKFIGSGCKVVWCYQFAGAAGLRISLNQHSGYSGESLDVTDLFDATITPSQVAFGAVQLPLQKNGSLVRDLINYTTRFSGSVTSFGGGGSNVIKPVLVTNGSSTVYPVVMQKGKFAIVAYGGTVSGDNEMSAAWKYVDYSKLIFELMNISSDDRLAMGYQYGKLVAGIGVDADYTIDTAAIENLVDATKDYPLEIGYVTSELTESLSNFYRNINYRYPNVKHVSHTKTHYAGSNRVAVTGEIHKIPTNGVITLKNPPKAVITSLTSDGGATVFTRNGGFQYGVPSATQYSTDYNLGSELFNGKIKFNLALAGTVVNIDYTYFDDFKEVVGSIRDIEALGVMTDRGVYTTMGSNSVSPTTYLQSEKEGIVLSEYLNFPNNFRNSHVADGIRTPMPSFNGNTLQLPNGNSGDDINILKLHTPSDFTGTVLPYIKSRNMEKELPFVGYIHDMLISENYGGSVWKSPSGTFATGWKQSTAEETIAFMKSFYKSYFDFINGIGVHWVTRTEYVEYYHNLNKNLEYNVERLENKVRIYITNNSGYSFKGVTFKIPLSNAPSSVKRLANESLPYSFSAGVAILWCDVPPNVSQVIEIETSL